MAPLPQFWGSTCYQLRHGLPHFGTNSTLASDLGPAPLIVSTEIPARISQAGGRGGDRTRGQRLMSPLLYH